MVAIATEVVRVGDAQVAAVLFGLGILLLAAKLGGLAAVRLHQPAVLGELLIGIGLGNLLPLVLDAGGIASARDEPTLRIFAEIGVLILLFDVGLEADLRALARVGISSLLVAVIGVAVPFALGFGASALLLPGAPALVHVFLGASLTATSVGITARVLKDLGAAQSTEGQTILGAALLDDVLGLVVLAVVTATVTAAAAGGPAPSTLVVVAIVAKAGVFLTAAAVAGHFLAGPLARAVGATGQRGLILAIGVTLCFSLGFVAEAIGMTAIVGAFAAGILLDPYGTGVRTESEERTLAELLQPLADLFVPLFFVLMGIQVDLASLADPSALLLGAALVVAAIVGKLACAAGVRTRGTDRLAVAIGMVPRGEVGLIFAGIGASLTIGTEPLLSRSTFSALVLMVLVTTLATPPGLRWALRRRDRRVLALPGVDHGPVAR